ncbi:hypothetical protein GF340_00030 [Candidatus Peregrinibacteria bacterium]|nr:hypothetical protein [Candidatus Peregrinibacteria bacterium]
MTNIKTKAIQNEDGLIELSVLGENLPDNLLGVSYYLTFDDPNIKLLNYEKGEIFGNENPFILLKQVSGPDGSVKIVTGISMPVESVSKLGDGEVVTYVLVPGERDQVNVGFEKGVLSVYDDGREDVENVVFNGNVVKVKALDQEQISDLIEEGLEFNVVDGQAYFLGLESELGVHDESERVGMTGFDPSLVHLYLFLGSFVIAVVGGGFLYYFLRKRYIRNKRLNGEFSS